MAKSNRDRVAEVMDALKDGLGPFVLREFKALYTQRAQDEIASALNSDRYEVPASVLESDETILRGIDVAGWLNLMFRRYNDVFRDKLSLTPRSYVSELIGARNDWAHQKPFTPAAAQRVAETAQLLLSTVGATLQAETAQDISRDLMRLRFEEEAKQSVKKASAAPAAEEVPLPLAQAGLTPWRMVVKPHPDVATGRYVQAEFAADLSQVVTGRAEPEYGNPHEFFRRTYLTEGLMSLLVNGLRRLTGAGGDPVVQLQTSFGGGKTHSMLALYHLFGGQIGLSEIPGGERILAQAGEVDDRVEAQRAVVVGTAFSATEPRRYKDATTHTLWGDLAYQLGGAAGYKLVERADLAGVSPGSDDLLALLEQHGPALIILDELVAFARNVYNATERLPAGTFDSIMSFVQSLTEAVRRSSDAILLVSVPESNVEIGGEGGKAALEALSKIIGRIESVWKPVTATESFEIVRRRLFSSEMDFAARDATVAAFRKLYRDQRADFPAGVAEADYADRLKAAYPIHPELFDRLYQDWSTLERFQRTRGVLRLMAAVIHQLWVANDSSLLILPGSLPLWATSVRNEMTRYLPENWSAILDTDIDGDESKPYDIDKRVPMLGQYSACRRVARAVFAGSAPSVGGQSVRGLEEVRIRLAVVQPGDQIAVFGDALRRMANQLTYLYSDGSRYWYDTRPTVNRIAQDRAQNLPLDRAHMELVERLRKIRPDRDKFAGAHIAPQTSADIADEPRVRAVVLDPSLSHKRGSDQSDALNAARDYLVNRGTAPRICRNMLVFIAQDATDGAALEAAVRDYLAWYSIDEEKESLNLDSQQRAQVRGNLKRANETVDVRLQEAYSWLLVPVQNDPTGPVEIQATRISGAESFFDRAHRKLRQSEWLIARWSPESLRMELNRFLWRGQPHVKLKQLWDDLAQYCYLPRLADQSVLLDAVRDGVARGVDEPFAYATLADDEGNYKGFVWRQASTTIYFDGNDVLVHPDAARRHEERLRQEQAKTAAVDTSHTVRDTPDTSDSGSVTPQSRTPPTKQPKLVTRYYGTVKLDPRRANREFGAIVEEIIERLTSQPGAQVEITLEISASRLLGFDEATQRTLSENSRTLKFSSHEFEGE